MQKFVGILMGGLAVFLATRPITAEPGMVGIQIGLLLVLGLLGLILLLF